MGIHTSGISLARYFGVLIGVVVMAAGVVGCEGQEDPPGASVEGQEDSPKAPAQGQKDTIDPRAEAERILREDGPRGRDIQFRKERARALAALGEAAVEPTAKAIESKDGATVMLASAALLEFGEKGRAPLIAALSSSNDRTRFWAARALKDTGDVRALPSLLKLVDKRITVFQEVRPALIKIGPPAVDGLITLLDSPQREIRQGAIEVLGKIGDDRAIEPLAALLGHHEFFTSTTAGMALEAYGARAIPALAKLLSSSNHSAVQNAAKALGKTGDARAAVILAEKLSSKGSNHYWTSGLVLLGPKAIDALLPVLKEDDTRRVRAAGDVLGRIRDPRLVAPILYAHDKVEHVATDALDRLVTMPEIVEKPALAVLQQADAPPDVRGAAAKLLGRIKAKSAVEPLIAVIRIDSKKVEVRAFHAEAIRALGAIGDSRAIAALEPVLDEDSSSMRRYHAIRSLGLLGAQGVVDRFIAELDSDVAWDVEESLFEALGSLKSVKAVPAISRCMKRHEGSFMRVVPAIQALEQIGGPAATRVIEGMATHKSPAVTAAAAKALGALGQPSSVKVLKTMTKGKDRQTLYNVAIACSQIGTPEAMDVLRILAVVDERNVRAMALSRLVRGDAKAVTFLIERYPDETDKLVRSTIIDRLMKNKVLAAKPIFLKAAKNAAIEPTSARTGAFWGLAAVGDESTVALLEKYLAETEAEKNRNSNSTTIYVYASARDALASLKRRLKSDAKRPTSPTGPE